MIVSLFFYGSVSVTRVCSPDLVWASLSASPIRCGVVLYRVGIASSSLLTTHVLDAGCSLQDGAKTFVAGPGCDLNEKMLTRSLPWSEVGVVYLRHAGVGTHVTGLAHWLRPPPPPYPNPHVKDARRNSRRSAFRCAYCRGTNRLASKIFLYRLLPGASPIFLEIVVVASFRHLSRAD